MSAESLTARTLHGLKWSYADTLVNSCMQIGYTAVMARLLSPADFGLVAMGGVVLRFGAYFAQMGIGSALVQKRELHVEDVRAGFTSSVLLGVLMFVVFWVAAPLAVWLFADPAVIQVVRVMALTFVMTGLSTTSLSLLRRDLAFRAIALTNIVSYVLGYGLGGIGLAWLGFGYWSLIAASLSQGALVALFAYLLTRHNVRFIFAWRVFKPLYGFGGRVSIIGFLEFITASLDTIVIGRSLGSSLLGVYNRAYMLISLPTYYLTVSLSRVLVPSYSRIQSELPRLRSAYLSSILLMGSLLVPMCWGMAVAAREIVLVVLGPQWVDSIRVLQILALLPPFTMLTHLTAALFEAKAILNSKLLIQVVYLLLLVVLFAVLGGYGINGYALAVVIGAACCYLLYIAAVINQLHLPGHDLVAAHRPFALAGVITSLAIFLVAVTLRQWGLAPWVILVAEGMTGGLVLALLLAWTHWQLPVRQELSYRLAAAGYGQNRTSWLYRVLTLLRIQGAGPEQMGVRGAGSDVH